jgi:catalase
VRDPYKFQNFIHTQKRNPETNLRDMTMQWDFWSQCPEALHQITILMSDRGIPATYRHLNGYGSHTYSLVNAIGERVWCKFHFKTLQGIRNMTDEESARVIGQDRESHQRDLFHAIAGGDFPKWRVCIQVMTQKQAESFRWNPFDLTKVWPHAEFPLIEVGVLELNRNPRNYHAEVEQAAFKPSALVPGIGASPDKMLQARLMSYADTHLYRLGVNHHQIPVNRPRCPVMNYIRDGSMADGSYGAATNYWPNSVASAPKPDPSFADPAWNLGQTIVDRFDSTQGHDDYTQAGNLFRRRAWSDAPGDPGADALPLLPRRPGLRLEDRGQARDRCLRIPSPDGRGGRHSVILGVVGLQSGDTLCREHCAARRRSISVSVPRPNGHGRACARSTCARTRRGCGAVHGDE